MVGESSPLEMNRWDGKTAVITGTSEEMNLAVAKALLDDGMLVVGMTSKSDSSRNEGANMVKTKIIDIADTPKTEDKSISGSKSVAKSVFQFLRKQFTRNGRIHSG